MGSGIANAPPGWVDGSHADVIIGRLVSSTMLSRLVTPVAYELLPPTLGEARPG